MGLNDTLASLGLSLTPPARQADAVKVKAALRDLADQIGKTGHVDVEQFDAMAVRLIEQYGQGRGRARPTTRELRVMCRHLFTPISGSELTLSQYQPIVTHCLDALENKSSASIVRNLADAFYFGFGSGSNALEQIAEGLNLLDPAQYFGATKTGLELKLFDPKYGPAKLAQHIQTSDAQPIQSLEAMGFVGGLEQSDFLEAVFEEFCHRSIFNAKDETDILNILDWGLKHSGDHEAGIAMVGQERYPRQRRVFVDALLLPWAEEGRSPSSNLEVRIRNLLLDTLGDPRFSSNAAAWESVSEDAKAIFSKWLNAASLRQFFDIVTETMKDSTEKRMWRYRRRFWTAYLPFIQDAWVVFAQEGERLAKHKAKATEDSSFNKFGRFSSYGVQSTHAVLLLRIGDTIIAEWSHNGKCRVWSASSERAPKLYGRYYTAADLRNGDWDIAHHQNEQYGWQGALARELARRTAVRVKRADYQVPN